MAEALHYNDINSSNEMTVLKGMTGLSFSINGTRVRIDDADVQELRKFINENFEPVTNGEPENANFIKVDSIDPADLLRTFNRFAKTFRVNNQK